MEICVEITTWSLTIGSRQLWRVESQKWGILSFIELECGTRLYGGPVIRLDPDPGCRSTYSKMSFPYLSILLSLFHIEPYPSTGHLYSLCCDWLLLRCPWMQICTMSGDDFIAKALKKQRVNHYGLKRLDALNIENNGDQIFFNCFGKRITRKKNTYNKLINYIKL